MVFAFLQASSPTLEEDFPKNQKWEKRLQQSIAHHTVMGWYSPSQNYLKIVPEDNHGQMLLACGGLANFSVLYTAEPNTKQYIYYQVRLSISAQLNLQKQFIKDDILRLTLLIVILFQYSQRSFSVPHLEICYHCQFCPSVMFSVLDSKQTDISL